jgi:hypothetical protein
MFNCCSKLNYVKMLATDISASNCLDEWLNGVSSTGTFVKHPDMASLPTGSSGIPSGWTVEDYVESNLITFTIDGTEYQAEEGMTWEDWCNSEYNIINAFTEVTIVTGQYTASHVSTDTGAIYNSDTIELEERHDNTIISNNNYVTKKLVAD